MVSFVGGDGIRLHFIGEVLFENGQNADALHGHQILYAFSLVIWIDHAKL